MWKNENTRINRSDLSWQCEKDDQLTIYAKEVFEQLVEATLLLEEIDEEKNQTIRMALEDSWMVNARLLIEFLQIPRKGIQGDKDFSVRDFSWAPNPDGDYALLNDVWVYISQNLIHLSRKRSPDSWKSFGAIALTDDVRKSVVRQLQHLFQSLSEYLAEPKPKISDQLASLAHLKID